jgi:membrane protease YdiL (CAAX protease family)
LTDSGPRLTEELHDEHVTADGADRRNETAGGQRQAWGRIDRKRLLMWAGIAFGGPGVLMLGVRLAGRGGTPAFSVRNELPVKVVMVFFVSLATWILSRVEKRSLDEYGIPLGQAFGRRFWEGTVWGFAMLSTILLVLLALGHFQIDSVALAGRAILRWALAWGVTFLAVSLSEELAFRCYWLFSMARRMRFWPAAWFLSAVFGVAHLGNKGENVLGIVQVVATGLLFCLMIRRTGNLWFAIGFHAAWDWAETFFYGTPDSGLLGAGRFLNSSVQGPNWLTGGSAGPEGSVLAFLVLALCALLIHLRFPTAIYPDRPI